MIRKAIIPVAGKGTRFLPITKIVSKTLFPIINKPTLQYLFEELLNTSIEEVLIVINDQQKDIIDYFDLNSEYYRDLSREYEELKKLENIINKFKIKFIIQKEPRGLGDAILCCKEAIGMDDFALLLGDDLVMKDNSEQFGIRDLLVQYQERQATYLGVQKVEWKDTSKYGIVKTEKIGNFYKLTEVVEKPKNNPPSQWACVGRYILKNNILNYLQMIVYDGVHEIQLTDAFNNASKDEDIYVFEFDGKRFDIGDHAGYVKATISYALKDEKIREEIQEYINKNHQ